MNPTGRFSNRVGFYTRYRPGYPQAALDVLNNVLHPDSVVADIGSGTGISSRWLLQRVACVYAVEPNREMREAAESAPGLIQINGTAEATGLPESSVDAIVCATAFHWFRGEEARREFLRILKPAGVVVLMWNIRKHNASAFQQGYEDLIVQFAKDYKPEADHESSTSVKQFFGDVPFQSAAVPNQQILDWEGLLGRAHSASYIPLPGDERYEDFRDRLRQLFDVTQRDGVICFEYETTIYWASLAETSAPSHRHP
jgi:SAM-dependent methyltransferase